MQKIILTLCLVLFVSSAYAGSCPMMAKNIDDKIKKAQELKDQGMDAHKAGDHAKSEKLLNEALTLFKSSKERKKMKNYMVTHTFKSKEMKDKFSETVASMKMEDIVKSMTSDKAACQMTWNTPGDTMQMFCWWKANSEADINNQLGQMNDFFEPHKFTECTDQVMDYNA